MKPGNGLLIPCLTGILLSLANGAFSQTTIMLSDSTVVNLAAPQIKEAYREKNHFWVSGGITSGESKSSFGAHGAVLIKSNRNLVTLRAISQGYYLVTEDPKEKFNEVALMYGVCNKESFICNSFSCGISYIRGMEQVERVLEGGWIMEDEYDMAPYTAAGFAVDLQLFIVPAPMLGFGINIVADLNKKNSFSGIVLGAQIGKLK